MKIFEDKRIILGITGSIAAYKTVELASSLTKGGALVDVILTEAAAKLVAPLTFASVTGRTAFVEEDLWQVGDHVIHIELGEKNQAFLIAPATANTIAKLAHGIADNLLTLSALASRSGLLVAPAMDGGMYAHPATQENITILKNRGVEVLGPALGHLASGISGKGRMLEPEELLGHLRIWLGKDGPLAGKKVIVSAGGTREPIDPVRFISNRSSGKQGYALAQAALDFGAEVMLITGPVCLPAPIGASVIEVEKAVEMAEAVYQESAGADVLVMAAAVADYQPETISDQKIKKGADLQQLSLKSTPDILKEVAKRRKKQGVGPGITVGFAAESEDLLKNAEDKLENKDLDLIAANDISSADTGFSVDTNQVTLIWRKGQTEKLPLLEKREVAERIMQEVSKLVQSYLIEKG
jgi:phosphopantothenoylcysteine decarboxylase/phosphopantothenate--cysteine ligase